MTCARLTDIWYRAAERRLALGRTGTVRGGAGREGGGGPHPQSLRRARPSARDFAGRKVPQPHPPGRGLGLELGLGATTTCGAGGGRTPRSLLERSPSILRVCSSPRKAPSSRRVAEKPGPLLAALTAAPIYPRPRLAWCGPAVGSRGGGGRDLLGAQMVPRAASSGVFCSALVGGRMLGCSRLIFILLSGTVTCLVAQQVPPVGELEPRRRRGARRNMVGGRADAGQTGLDRPLAVSLQGSVCL